MVGERFSTTRIDAVYCSPLKRAFDTGVQVAKHHRLEPVVVPDLREVEVFRDIPPDQPALEFLGRRLLLGVRERMLRERSWDVYPYPESSHDFRKRTVSAVEGIIGENEGKRVAIACHGGVINAYIAHIIGARYDMFFRPAHTAMNVVYAGEGARALQSLNDGGTSSMRRTTSCRIDLEWRTRPRMTPAWAGGVHARCWAPRTLTLCPCRQTGPAFGCHSVITGDDSHSLR